MKDDMWRLFRETGLVQAYMLYRYSDKVKKDAGRDEHIG